MERKIPFHFDIFFEEGGLHPTSDPELCQGKVRVFYKYSNRNGSYITDEFAEKLALSAYNKPIIGCYDVMRQDFLGHEGPEKAKAYGFVIPNSLTWTEHLDEDGIVRTYATYDVLVWAKYWKEAAQLFNKTQSMEIDPETVRGDWRVMGDDGFEEYVYTEGVMAGLCILGDAKTPCFEGAAFFSINDDSYVQFTEAIKKYFSNGGKEAVNVKVTGLEHEKFEALFNALNPNFNEDGSYSMDFIPCEITDEHVFALVGNAMGKVNKYSYSFEEEECHIELVEEIDYKTEFENLTTVSTQNLEEAQRNFTELTEKFEELTRQYAELEASKQELQSQFEQLQVSMEEAIHNAEETQNNFNTLSETLVEKDTLISSQREVIADYENKEKDAIISKFSANLPAEVLQTIVDKKDTLSINELKTELALEYTNFSMAKEQGVDIRIPQQQEEPALFKILKAYKK